MTRHCGDRSPGVRPPARQGVSMSPESLDAAMRRLGHWRSRRAAVGSIAAIAMSAVASVSEARKRDRTRKKKRDTGSCTVRHSEQEILNFIAKAARKYGQSERVMVRVARCESVLDPCAVNPSGPYYGLFQFLKSTWKTTPYRDRDIFDPEAQSLATAWMWKEGRKNEWACQ
jgi:Transglycosylase SLT domain